VYFATFVQDGALRFGSDIYGRDEARVRALYF